MIIGPSDSQSGLSGGINYFQNQGKLIKSQQQKSRLNNNASLRLKQADLQSQDSLPKLNSSQTRSEGKYKFKTNIPRIPNQSSTMTLKDEIFADEETEPYQPKNFVYGDLKKSPEKIKSKLTKNYTEQNVSLDKWNKFPSPHMTVDTKQQRQGVVLTPLVA